MRYLCAAIALLLFATPLSADEHFDVRVLYCGDPGSQRETDYRAFLARHFTKVTLRDLREFTEHDADGQDVVIFDWSYGYNGKGSIDQKTWQRLRAPQLSMKFTRPTILVGRAGGSVANSLKLKTNWLCLCLEGPAHHLALDHRLFHSLLEVDPHLEQMPTPVEYPYLTLDKALGPTMTVWKVQTKDYPETDPGLVSSLYGFNDSPDAEVFAQGIAGKGPDTVPLGRHANFFLWGFSAPPADMTPAAKRLFVNAVCYMRQFDGQTPLVRFEAPAREWALRQAMCPRFLSEDYKQTEIARHRAALKQHPEWIPENHKGNVEAYILEMVRTTQAAYQKRMDQVLPARLRKQFGMDGEKYSDYYKQNLEYVRPTHGFSAGFIIDEDAKTVGPSNRSIEMLERCVSKLQRNDQPDLALRLLTRYTPEHFETAAQWRTWLDANRRRLFFSDVGGYKFFVARSDRTAPVTSLSKQN